MYCICKQSTQLSITMTKILPQSSLTTMSWPRTPGCAYRWRARTRRIVLWCGRLGRTQAETRHHRQYSLITELLSDLIRMMILTHRGGEHTAAEPDGVSLHLMLDHLDLDRLRLQRKTLLETFYLLISKLSLITSCPVNCFVASSLVFTNLLMSLSSLFPKSC